MGKDKSRIVFIDGPAMLNKERLTDVLLKVAGKHNASIKKLIYQFVSREKILEINKAHLNHEYLTDIITFDYGRLDNVVGDVFICTDVVEDNAQKYKVEPSEELCRVVFHGLLHLVGFDDTTDELKRRMRNEEDACLMLMN